MAPENNHNYCTLFRLSQVQKISGLKKSAIYLKIKEGTFPKPVRLGSKAVAWRSDELSAWVESRPRVS